MSIHQDAQTIIRQALKACLPDQAVRRALEDEAIIDPKKFMAAGREAVRQLCIHKIKLCGSDGKA